MQAAAKFLHPSSCNCHCCIDSSTVTNIVVLQCETWISFVIMEPPAGNFKLKIWSCWCTCMCVYVWLPPCLPVYVKFILPRNALLKLYRHWFCFPVAYSHFYFFKYFSLILQTTSQHTKWIILTQKHVNELILYIYIYLYNFYIYILSSGGDKKINSKALTTAPWHSM